MLTFAISSESKEKALKLRDVLNTSLVGIPAFIENDIIVNTQDLDAKTKVPLNEDGDLKCFDPATGKEYKHCVRLIISSSNQKENRNDATIIM